jgi:ABC-type uncharacterized transport system permease subunit
MLLPLILIEKSHMQGVRIRLFSIGTGGGFVLGGLLGVYG